MKTLGFILFLSFALFSCSKTQEEIPGLKTYKDSKYLFSLKYVPKKMMIKHYEPERKDDWKLWISLDTDLSDEFPQDIEQGVYMGLYTVKIYTEKGFKDFFGNTGKEQYDEGNLNGIPAFVAKNDKGQPWSYILMIPGIYLDIWPQGSGMQKHAPSLPQAVPDRFKQLTLDMLKHFKWEQAIDTNSEEFRAWKKHIWGILTEPKEKQ